MFSWTWDLRKVLDRKERQRSADALRLAREREEVAAFLSEVLEPALEQIRCELEPLGRTVAIHRSDGTYHLMVRSGHRVEFDYSIKACRKRRSLWLHDYASEVLVEYAPVADRTYDLREIRRTTRGKVARQVLGDYRKRVEKS